MSEVPLIVTAADLRTARYCFAGVRPWFARHGLDWQAFIEQGISADTYSPRAGQRRIA